MSEDKRTLGQMLKDGIKNTLKGITIKALVIILLISVSFNVMQIYSKGISIDKSDRSDRSDRRVTHQEQMQGQLFIQNEFVRGDRVVWDYKTFVNTKDVTDYLMSLHPTSSYFSQVNTVTNNENVLTFIVWTPSVIYSNSPSK